MPGLGVIAEKRLAQMIFQLANVLAHRSLGDVQLQRCAVRFRCRAEASKRSQGIERAVHGDPLVFLGLLSMIAIGATRGGAISSRSFKMMGFRMQRREFSLGLAALGLSRWRLRSVGRPADISKTWNSAMEGLKGAGSPGVSMLDTETGLALGWRPDERFAMYSTFRCCWRGGCCRWWTRAVKI